MNRYQRTPRLPDEPHAEWMARIEAVRLEDIAANRRAARQDRADEERLALRFIYADLPTCDDCGSIDLKTNRTVESSEDAITRSVSCRRCGAHFRLMLLAKNLE